MTELKICRCPFCASEDAHLESYDDFTRVECNCGAIGQVFGDEEAPLRQRERDAVEAWNRVSEGYYAPKAVLP